VSLFNWDSWNGWPVPLYCSSTALLYYILEWALSVSDLMCTPLWFTILSVASNDSNDRSGRRLFFLLRYHSSRHWLVPGTRTGTGTGAAVGSTDAAIVATSIVSNVIIISIDCCLYHLSTIHLHCGEVENCWKECLTGVSTAMGESKCPQQATRPRTYPSIGDSFKVTSVPRSLSWSTIFFLHRTQLHLQYDSNHCITTTINNWFVWDRR